jgi:hypothetical protein
MEIPEELLKEIAEQIILDRTTDIDYGSIVEYAIDALEASEYVIYLSNQDKIFEKIDELVNSAQVIVEFPESDA